MQKLHKQKTNHATLVVTHAYRIYMNISEHFSCFLYKNNCLTRANVLKSQNADYKMMTMIIIILLLQ